MGLLASKPSLGCYAAQLADLDWIPLSPWKSQLLLGFIGADLPLSGQTQPHLLFLLINITLPLPPPPHTHKTVF